MDKTDRAKMSTMTGSPGTSSQIAPITNSDCEAAVDVLFRSFHGDPTLRWSFEADREGYDDRLRAYLRLGDEWHRGLGHPAVAALSQSGEMLGVAYLMSPDIETTERDLDRLIEDLRRVVGDGCAGRFQKQNAVVDDASPDSESHLLALVGVIPEAQGQGVGSKLVSWTLRESVDHPESEGVLLATGTERNLVFYRRLGFEVVAEVDVDDLHEWILFAEAREPSGGSADGASDASGRRGGGA